MLPPSVSFLIEDAFVNVFHAVSGEVIAVGTPKEIEEKTNTTNIRDAFFKLIGGSNYEVE